MSDQDRGAYTPPTDSPLSFDARQPVRGSRPLPLTLIASGVVLVLLAIAIVAFYRSGVRQAGEAPRTVGVPVGEITAPAPADAQPQDAAAGLQIYKSEAGEPATPVSPTFTAPPEQPAARPEPAPLPAATPPPPKAAPTSPVVAKPAPAATAAGLKPAQPIPAPAAKAPAAKTIPPAAAPVAKATPAPATGGGAASVQIGAFSSQAQVESGWADAARIAPGAIAGKARRVEPIQRGGQTLYRTSVAGFASRADAQAFCGQLKAAGKSCFVK